jgi:hypothetical protein
MFEIWGINMASRNTVFPRHALSMITARTREIERHKGTVIKAYRRLFLIAAVNHTSLHISMKFLKPMNVQLPIPLVKSQLVKLIINEKIIGRRVKETMPNTLGSMKA